MDSDYQEMATKLKDQDGWDVPGIITDVRDALQRDEHVPNGIMLAIIDYALKTGVDYLVDLLAKAILASPDKRLTISSDERDYSRDYRSGELSFIYDAEGLSIKWKAKAD